MSNATTELVQQLIRNQCVNDGTPESGHESRNVDVLETLFNGHHLEVARFHERKGRESLVVRMVGREPNAPKLLLQGHTDVVPAHAPDWDHDPFGGELIDGIVHGRGAVDMFNITGSMAIAMANLSREGFIPRGDVIFAAVADEEAGGNLGAGFLVRQHHDLVQADYVLSESGGTHMHVDGETYLPVVVGEKGVHWITIEIDGKPSHGSKPYGSDNAIITANDILNKFLNYKAPVQFVDGWETFLHCLALDKSLINRLSDHEKHDDALHEVDPALASVLHSCAHNTFSPNVIHGGVKVNTVADKTVLQIDIRSLPHTTLTQVENMIADILGPHADNVKISYQQHEESTISPTDTPLWDALGAVSASIFPGAKLLPTISTFGTDSRFWRREGAIAYGAALFAPDDTNYENHLAMFHGRNEQVSAKSLQHTTDLYEGVVRSLGDFVPVR